MQANTGSFLIMIYKILKFIETRRVKNNEQREFNLSENLMLFLTKDITNTFLPGNRIDETSKQEYLEIIRFAIGRELDKIKKSGKCKARPELLKLFRSNQKFREVIAPNYGFKGEGYRFSSNRPIIISPDKSQQINRLLVLLVSKKSGNDNPDGIKEYTAILDELLNKKEISKLQYKLLYYKYKDTNEKDPRFLE